MESQSTTTKAPEKEAEDAFAKRIMDITNSAYLAGVIGLAKELRLFETMVTFSEPKSIEVIAKASNIKPR